MIKKKHDSPKTRTERLLLRTDISAHVRWNVHAVRQSIDPIAVATQVASLQRRLISMAVKIHRHARLTKELPHDRPI